MIRWLPCYTKKLYWKNEIINQFFHWDRSKGITSSVWSTSMPFPKGVGIFDLIFLIHFITKMRSFCAHQKGTWYLLWPSVKHKQAFFRHHVYLNVRGVSEPSWPWLSDEHWNYVIITNGAWDKCFWIGLPPKVIV